jgi:hypothetical protein
MFLDCVFHADCQKQISLCVHPWLSSFGCGSAALGKMSILGRKCSDGFLIASAWYGR